MLINNVISHKDSDEYVLNLEIKNVLSDIWYMKLETQIPMVQELIRGTVSASNLLTNGYLSPEELLVQGSDTVIFLEHVTKVIKHDSKVAVLGARTGLAVEMLLNNNLDRNVELTLIDESAGMLKRAEERLRRYGIYVCKIEIYEKGLKYGWEEVEYLWKGKLESPLVLDYIINNIKNWDKLIQKEQQATLLLFEQGEDIYAHALYKETKILQYLNHSLSKKVLGYLHENANATILEIGAGTGATSNKVLSDIRENKFEEHIVYFYTDISRFFLQRAKERYKECDGKIEMHHQTLDIDEAFSSQLPSNFQADIVIAVGVLNNSVNTDKCIYEINSVMKPGGILLVIETVEDVPDILITQSFMMTAPKDRRKATNTMFLNRKQWLEILEENGFCNSEEFPGYGEYLEVLGQKLFYCTKE